MSPRTRPALQVGMATDVGRVRDHNEDSALAEGSIFIVADGMGGHAAGEVASAIVVDALRELAPRCDLTRDDITAQVDLANERILEAVGTNPEQRGMGTTASGLALIESGGSWRWFVLNVGDSRVYRFRDGELTQQTVDHSEVQELVDAGIITPEQARVHPARNVVTRCLGNTASHRPDTWELPLRTGERFLACSDGLTNELSDGEMRDILQAHPDPQIVAEELVHAAVAAGGRDNVTVVVVRLDDAESDAVGG